MAMSAQDSSITDSPMPVVRCARPPVRLAALARSAHGAGRASQAEQPHLRVRQRERRRRQRQHHRRQQHRDRHEDQHREHRTDAQHRLFGEEREHRPDQLQVRNAHRGQCASRERLPQQAGDDQRGRGRHQIHRAPADKIGQRARHRPRQQDADDDAAGDDADHAAALARRGHECGVGDQHLRDDGQQAHGGHRRQQDRRAGRQRNAEQGDHRQQRLPHDQLPPVDQVTQRNDQQQRPRP